MKRFEIYATNLSHGFELGDNVIILQNEILDNMDSIICAPIMFGRNEYDKNNTHIHVNTKNGKMCAIIAEHMINLDRKKISGMVDELAVEDCQNVNIGFRN